MRMGLYMSRKALSMTSRGGETSNSQKIIKLPVLWLNPTMNGLMGISAKRIGCIYPPTQKTTGLPVDECENKQVFCSGDVRPFLEKADRNLAQPNTKSIRRSRIIQKGPRLQSWGFMYGKKDWRRIKRIVRPFRLLISCRLKSQEGIPFLVQGRILWV